MTSPPAARGLGARTSLVVPAAAAVVAFTAQMLWVRRFSVSVPFWDEWNDLYDFLATWRAGDLTWAGFFAQHMEHRLPVARVFFILVDAVFGEGSQLGLLTLHALLMAVIVAIWVYTLRRLGEPLWLVAATLVVLLSPSQQENWLWGFQVEFFTLVGPVVAAVCWVALAPRLTWPGVIGCVVACAVSSYSIASGLSSWAAIGLLLALRVCLDRGWSWRGLIGARREAAQLLAFLAAGIMVTAAYFYGYQELHPLGAHSRTWGAVTQWIGAALVFPLIDPLVAGDIPWLPAAVALVFAPIAAALVLYARRGDRARLLLTTGLLLMVAGNVGLMALGRSGVVFVASRYGTVCLWTGAISLLALAALMRASRDRWRAAAVPIGLIAALLVGLHLWRYTTFVDDLQEVRRSRSVWAQNMRVYLSDDSPDRQLPAIIPFPADPIKPLLYRPQFLATLPYNLRPPARVRTAGDAWSLDSVPPGGGTPAIFAWGSWSGADSHTGTLTSTPFRAPRGLNLAVSGYPTRPGNSLAIESVTDPTARLVYSGRDPGDGWTVWRVDPSQFPGRRIRVVAVDGRQADGAWLGIGFPADRSVAVRVLEAIVRYLEWWAALALALIGGWAIRLRRRSGVADRAIHRAASQPA
jgi:hypothetical protein